MRVVLPPFFAVAPGTFLGEALLSFPFGFGTNLAVVELSFRVLAMFLPP